MKRREFTTLLGGAAAAWPLTARTQQQTAMPVIGVLHLGSPEANASMMAAFRQGLAAAGYVEGRNVDIEYRWAHGDADRLSQLAADLVRRRASLIAAPGSVAAALAAKAATATIPIVFNSGTDPVEAGLVASLNRPGGNITGISYMNTLLGAKRLGMLRELLPTSTRFAILVNPASPTTEAVVMDLRAAAASVGCDIEVHAILANGDSGPAVTNLVRSGAKGLLTNTDQLIYDRRIQLLTLTARYRLPVIFPAREWADAGGLMSYGSSFAEQHREAGAYAGRILRGEKPADLPILRATKFELVINLQTAKALDIDVPPTLLARADEIIE
jgi:putative tryptophan/tyrosine transport system substrate-binding protein